MINILVNNLPAVIEDATTIEYILENSAFESSDGYTLQITFPLDGVPENVRIFGFINLPFIARDFNKLLPCSIQCGAWKATGSLSIMEIAEDYVKGQFLENVDSDENSEAFENTYINEMDLGNFPETNPKNFSPKEGLLGSTDAFCLPWTGADDINAYNNLSASPKDGDNFHEYTEFLTWQPRLLKIIETIVYQLGYKFEQSYYDFLMQGSKWFQAIICNTLPQTWRVDGYAPALPHWTVSEFFSKLQIFMGGRFTFDHVAKTVGFSLETTLVEKAGEYQVADVVDEYTSTINYDEEDADYLPIKRYKYKDDDSLVWKYLCCPGFIEDFKDSPRVEYYATMDDLKDKMISWFDWTKVISGTRNTFPDKINYVIDIDTYFVMRYHCVEPDAFDTGGPRDFEYNYLKFGELQPINIFGPNDYDRNADYEELDFVPVPVDWSEKGKMMFLPIPSMDDNGEDLGEYSEDASGNKKFGEKGWSVPERESGARLFFGRDLFINQSQTANYIEEYEEKEIPSYYDRIYIGFVNPEWAHNDYRCIYPMTDIDVLLYKYRGGDSHLLRLTNGSVGYLSQKKIDQKIMYSFSFVADKIPDVKATFIINGVRFVCRKLTVKISNKGIKKLIKGEFYPLID